jgi:hypothetical protein
MSTTKNHPCRYCGTLLKFVETSSPGEFEAYECENAKCEAIFEVPITITQHWEDMETLEYPLPQAK